jgi:uncharacterized protein YndB with AHSA1/START domain
MDADLETIAGNPVLRFERRFTHPVNKVWRAITDPAEMAHWFPAAVETELEVGAPMRFTLPHEAPIEGTRNGEILELDPPKVYAFRWNRDVLRFELVPEGDGCRLYFTQALGGGAAGRLGAGRNAAGWDHCLRALQARLHGHEPQPFTEWLSAMEHYIERFGLAEGHSTGTTEGYKVRFARDLVWKPVEDVWRQLTEGTDLTPGAPPPASATNGRHAAGAVTRVSAPNLLEYSWEHDGRVRWEIVFDPDLGTRVELTQTVPTRLVREVPAVLAAWHTHLERFFLAVHGETRPWPEDRTKELEKHYADTSPTS